MPPKGKKVGIIRGPKPRAPKGAASVRRQRGPLVGGAPSLQIRSALRSGHLAAPLMSTAGTAGGVGGPVVRTAPASLGMALPKSFFGFGGRAQEVADMDPDQSLRVMGRDLYVAPLTSNATDQAGFGVATYYQTVAPLELSLRLKNMEEIFSFYAIRHVRFYYAPSSASTSTVQIALGYSPNYAILPAAIPTPSQTQVMEMPSSGLFPAWLPAMIEMKHDGTRLYNTSSAGPDPTDFDYQGILACRLLNATGAATLGQLWVEYVVDFYQPSPVLTDPSEETCRMLHPLGCYRRIPRLRPSIPETKKDERKAAPAAPATGDPVRVAVDDDYVEPSPPGYRPAPSVAPGPVGYRIPSAKRA